LINDLEVCCCLLNGRPSLDDDLPITWLPIELSYRRRHEYSTNTKQLCIPKSAGHP
ncbi:4991_t:CDS:1, partial [Acaulospora morrowiae]